MKKLLCILASIIMIGTMATSCSKDNASDEDFRSINHDKYEAMLIGHWSSGYTFNKDHTFTEPNTSGGTWQLTNDMALIRQYYETTDWGDFVIGYICWMTNTEVMFVGGEYSWKKR